MVLTRKFIRFFILILTIFGFSGIANAACDILPQSISITSGNDNLGNYNSGERVYINPDLANEPIKLDFNFRNDEEGCYVQENIKFKLFSTSIELEAEAFSESSDDVFYNSVASYDFNPNFLIIQPFTSTFSIQNKYGNIGTGNLVFDVDPDDPVISSFTTNASNVVRGGSDIEITFSVEDVKSGLESVRLTGGVTPVSYTFENNEKANFTRLVETVNSDTTYTLVVKDKLGNTVEERIEVKVDSTAPVVTNLQGNFGYESQLVANFRVTVTDDSFSLLTGSPEIFGDFSSINPARDNVRGTCLKIDSTEFDCSFPNIAVDLEETQSVTVSFTASDPVGNIGEYELSTVVEIDTAGPEILEFYGTTDLGIDVRNILSAYPDPEFGGPFVILTYREESIQDGYPLLNIDLGLIPFAPEPSCESVGVDTITCVWDLTSRVDVYKPFPTYTDTYEVQLTDFFSNSNSESINVSFDNLKPSIDSIEIIETNDIKDGLVQSGERINIRAFVSDKNLEFSGNYLVFLDVRNISANVVDRPIPSCDFSNLKNRERCYEQFPIEVGSCSKVNTSTARCDFNGIEVINGYLNTSINLFVGDIALNYNKEVFPIEIFNVSDEVVTSFRVSDAEILNPLNRNLVLANGGRAWYEPEIERVGDNDMVIVNYQMETCNDTEIDPILIVPGSIEFFPDDVVINVGQEDLNKFVMRYDLRAHTNINDLNNKSMTCRISLLKRDGTTVYPPEIIPFKLNLEFFDIPRGDLLSANAKDILEDIEDAQVLGGWFDSIFDIYVIFDNVCGVVGSANGVISGVSSAWQSVSLVLRGTVFGTPVAEAGDRSIDPMQSLMSNFFSGFVPGQNGGGATNSGGFGSKFIGEGSPVKKMCDYVTCRNGGLIRSGLLESAQGLEEEFLSSNFCSSDGFLSKKFEKIGGDSE